MMPLSLMLAHLEMLPRLQAEESLRVVAEQAIGSGSAGKEFRQRQLRDLERVARPRRSSDGRLPLTPQQRGERFAGMGFAVIEESS